MNDKRTLEAVLAYLKLREKELDERDMLIPVGTQNDFASEGRLAENWRTRRLIKKLISEAS